MKEFIAVLGTYLVILLIPLAVCLLWLDFTFIGKLMLSDIIIIAGLLALDKAIDD